MSNQLPFTEPTSGPAMFPSENFDRRAEAVILVGVTNNRSLDKEA